MLLGKHRIPSVYCHIKTLAGMEDEEWKHILSNPRTAWLPLPAPSGSHPAAKLSGRSQSSPGRPDPVSSLSWVLDQHSLSFPGHFPPAEQLLIPISLPVVSSAP